VALAHPVAAQHGHALAVPEFEVERVGQPGDLEALADHGALAGAGAAEPHVDALVADLRRSFVFVEELTQLRLGRLQLGREGLADAGPLAHQLHVVLEPLALVVVEGTVAISLVVLSGLRLCVPGERAAVRPGAPRLDRDDLGGGGGQQLAVVADVEHGLAGVTQLCLEPAFGRNVEEVVGLVEHENVELAAQQGLEREALLLAAAERSQRTVANTSSNDSPNARVTHSFQVTSRSYPPPSPHDASASAYSIGASANRASAAASRVAASRSRTRCDRQQQLVHGARRVVGGADELMHHADLAVDADRSRGGGQVAGDQLEQGRLAGTVGADDGDPVAVAHLEADIAEELVAARQSPGEVADSDRSHERRSLRVRSVGPRVGFPCEFCWPDRARDAPGSRVRLPLPRRRRTPA
jgi:hypothetical protein